MGYLRFVRNEKLIESDGPRQAGGIQAEIAVSVVLVALVAVYCASILVGQEKAPGGRGIRGIFSSEFQITSRSHHRNHHIRSRHTRSRHIPSLCNPNRGILIHIRCQRARPSLGANPIRRHTSPGRASPSQDPNHPASPSQDRTSHPTGYAQRCFCR